MKLIVCLIAGVLLAMPMGHANAQPVDCEAARCTIQATIDAECSCADAKNHGRYTACVARVVNRSARERLIPRKCRNKINGCAIRSTCGKKEGSVACDFPGDGVAGRCRPLSSESKCTGRGGTVVASCCDTCGAPEPTATTTPEGPVATATEGPVATATEGPIATSTPETPEPTPTEGPLATATEAPLATATPEGPVETPTEGAATATPEGPVETATATPEGPVATTTEGPVATSTPEEPVPTPTSTPAGPTCGNNTIDTGEDCDPPGSSSCANAGNGLEVCSMSCTCECPTKITFSGDATDPVSILDTGTTGIAHRAPVITNGDVTVNVSCLGPRPSCRGPQGQPCTVSGPIANGLPGQLQNRRCTNNTFVQCTDSAQCQPRICIGGSNNGTVCTVDSQCPSGACPAASCEYFFGSNLPLAAGGVTTCVANQFFGSISGTADIETGEATTIVNLRSRVHLGPAVDNPCPRCVNDPVNNDGVFQGTCDDGPRKNLNCDGGGSVPGRPDFGTTSLDCPPFPAGIIATLPIDLSSQTNPVIKTLSATSPNCSDSPGNKCLCDTCNSLASEPCDANSDCPFDPPGALTPICGGKRCLSGPNVGMACIANSECPGAAQNCGKPGAATKPSGCQDDTTVVNRVHECADPDGDGEGECQAGPSDGNCSVASGHAQRGCTDEGACGGVPGSCISAPRGCFLTGGGTFQAAGTADGTDTLIAIGMEDPPMNDVAHPTLGAVFCVAPTAQAAVNNVAGLPGPGRVTIRGTALGLP